MDNGIFLCESFSVSLYVSYDRNSTNLITRDTLILEVRCQNTTNSFWRENPKPYIYVSLFGVSVSVCLFLCASYGKNRTDFVLWGTLILDVRCLNATNTFWREGSKPSVNVRLLDVFFNEPSCACAQSYLWPGARVFIHVCMFRRKALTALNRLYRSQWGVNKRTIERK